LTKAGTEAAKAGVTAPTQVAASGLQRFLQNPHAQSGAGFAGFIGGMEGLTALTGGHGEALTGPEGPTVDDIMRFGKMFDDQGSNLSNLQQQQQLMLVLEQLGIDPNQLSGGFV
jgi:hypothetical protein